VFMLTHLAPGWVGGVLTAVTYTWLVDGRALETMGTMTWWLDSCLLLKWCFQREDFAVDTNNVSTLMQILKNISCDTLHALSKQNLQNRYRIEKTQYFNKVKI
jgi:hypothetical protein